MPPLSNDTMKLTYERGVRLGLSSFSFLFRSYWLDKNVKEIDERENFVRCGGEQLLFVKE